MNAKVLVFPCGSEIGLELHNALKWSTHVELYGASSVPNHGRFVYKNYIDSIPDVTSRDFIAKLNDIVDAYSIDFIFPAHDSVILELLRNQHNLHCRVISSSLETAEICRSKKKTYEYFQGKIAVPAMYTSSQEIVRWPVFLKPEIGQGSRGVFTAYSEEERRFYIEKDHSLLVLEFLPGKEYTVDCFTDRHGKLRFVGPRERARVSNGISVATYDVTDDRFIDIASSLNRELSFRGMWFFQLKENSTGDLVLLEIAPRVSGSMGLNRNKGVNFALLSIFDFLEQDIELTPNVYPLQMDRALFSRFSVPIRYEYVYVDFDDTLVFRGRVNTFLMMFIFQAMSQGIKLCLLSRHKAKTGEDMTSVLKRYRLTDIFDEIIDVYEGEPKSRYITQKDAIFIDDSYAERNEVSRKRRIPVFEVSMVEILIDWRY